MKKHDLRKEFFKLKFKGHSYGACRRILKAQFDYKVTIRTLKRWAKRIDNGDWIFARESEWRIDKIRIIVPYPHPIDSYICLFFASEIFLGFKLINYYSIFSKLFKHY